jgi:pyruvate dehydrogenase E2 component (dihydrolipoamide acetyltransferase)
MAENILMIALSPTMEKGQILKWNKKPGDVISSGDVICEVETDKAAMDYEATVDGVLLDIIVPEGGNAVVGEPIAIIGQPGEKAPSGSVAETIKITPEHTANRAADGFLRIDDSEDHAAADVHDIHDDEEDDDDEDFVFDEPEGADVDSGEVDLQFIFDAKKMEKPPTAVELTIPVPIPENKPKEMPVGNPESVEIKAEPAVKTSASFAAPAEDDGRIRVSPLARKAAQELGIALAGIVGSGPAGRIIKKDVEEAARAKQESPKPETVILAPHIPHAALQAASAAALPMPVPVQKPAAGNVIPVSGKRKLIARRLSESKFTAPHYYLKLSIEMDNILEARSRLNSGRKEKISLNGFIIKFAAETLKRHAIVNSTWNGDTITLHDNIDIGVAVALPDGLVTPVIRDCGNKGITAIDAELKSLIDKARNGTLQTEEYKNPTFTISNLGNYGIEDFTAIINPPGSAILAIGAIKKELVVKDDFDEEEDDHVFYVQSMMRVTMSCDHRVIDGAAGAEFMRDLKDLMEDPVKLLM